MADLKQFRKDNNLTQSQLGDYLGVKKSFICSIEKQTAKLPQEKLTKLLNNDKGWCVTALLTDSQFQLNNFYQSSQGDNSPVSINRAAADNSVSEKEIEFLRKENERLAKLLEEEKLRSVKYWEMIETLMKKGM